MPINGRYYYYYYNINFGGGKNENQECQPLLKAKYCPRAMPVQHYYVCVLAKFLFLLYLFFFCCTYCTISDNKYKHISLPPLLGYY